MGVVHLSIQKPQASGMFSDSSPLLGPRAYSGQGVPHDLHTVQNAANSAFTAYYSDGHLYVSTPPTPRSPMGTPLVAPERRFLSSTASRLFVLSSVSFLAGLGLLITGLFSVPNALRFRLGGAACLSLCLGLRCAANRSMQAPTPPQSPTI